MLIELVVEGLGVIERAELELEPGCSALTGETGAGKTLVVAALGLLVGGRSDRALVREGASEARIQGRFVVGGSHDAVEILRAHGILEDPDPSSDVEIVMTRTIAADKGGKARINGRLVTVAALNELGECLVEIAGQHEAQGIGAPPRQRMLLDSFAGPDVLTNSKSVADAVRAAARTKREFEELLASERERERELDLLRYEINEITRAELREGEHETLVAEASRLEHAESIALALEGAGEALRGEGGAAETLTSAYRDVDQAARRDPSLAELARRLEAASLEVADVADELARSLVAPDPGLLDETRQRLDVISRLRRKYGETESEILDYLDRKQARVAELEGAESSLELLRTTHEQLLERAHDLAASLHEKRARAAVRLERAMEETLATLALDGARFEVALADRELYEGGIDAVELRVAANPGESPRPVAKVASGGELSRIALALHLLTSTPGAETMVFDEVDAGVGGRAAQSVGRSLAELAATTGAQVLVVTHLPQVAAFADTHYRVAKEAGEVRASAMVARVEGAERVDELSRMLAGMPESDRAREHAQELLDSAAR
jgi:DNA repair protein RecN (Recombination protein N)